ncbi:hypothetical protein FHW67_000911 [Herbaspirillum sp. Sphag1AN]|nr:hypothetical protein [Herbaspirillum sp. Sphag1AN]MBB3245069.1 hypothetical protein [Herbaspirillum sp. Sphag64]
MKNILVTHGDMRSLGYCNRGARAWFKRHQLDWCVFLDHGLPAPTLLATRDGMAEEVVAVARSRTQAWENDGC